MSFFVLAQMVSLRLALIRLRCRPDHDKDVEILLRRQHLRILPRKQPRAPRISRWEKCTVVVVAGKRTGRTTAARARLAQVVLLFKPDTVLRWHRDLVRRTWSFAKKAPVGRPPIRSELDALILRLAKENPSWGYGTIAGEPGAPWAKLGDAISRSTIRDVLKRNRIPPAAERGTGGDTGKTVLAHHTDQMVACDVVTVETAGLNTLDVLLFIELGSRRVHLAGCTANPPSAWVTRDPSGCSTAVQLDAPGWKGRSPLPDSGP